MYNSIENYLRIYRTRFLNKSDTFLDYLLKKCKGHANEAINVPIEVKIA